MYLKLIKQKEKIGCNVQKGTFMLLSLFWPSTDFFIVLYLYVPIKMAFSHSI